MWQYKPTEMDNEHLLIMEPHNMGKSSNLSLCNAWWVSMCKETTMKTMIIEDRYLGEMWFNNVLAVWLDT
jgi:hypothetical protein